jgi:hypothetical protein
LKKTKNVEKKIGISEKTITSDVQWQFYCFSEGFYVNASGFLVTDLPLNF